MIVGSARLTPYSLPLRTPWRTSRGTLALRHGWLLRIETRCGRTGYGDCAPLPGHDRGAATWLAARLETLPGRAVAALLADLEENSLPPGAPPADHAALESALLDLTAQAADRPLAALLEPAAPESVGVNAALGPLDGTTAGRAGSAFAAGFRVLKIKVGLAAAARELALLTRVADAVPGARLRLDANGAWDHAGAAAFVAAAAGLPIESLEEPLAVPTVAALGELQAGAPFPIALDESLPLLGGAAIDSGAVHRIVLKPGELGGPRPALALARRAAATGIEAVVTSSLESAAGVWTAAHLAAALPLGGLAHGLDTARWLTRDLGAPPVIADARIQLGAVRGLGFRTTP